MSEKLAQKTCNEFTELLASEAPIPGGGGVAALAGAMSCALCSMVGNLTKGKKKYAQYEEDVLRMVSEAQALRLNLQP